MPITENSSAIYHLCGMKHWLKEMGRQRQNICYHKGEYPCKKNRWLLNYFFIKCHLNLNLIEFLSDDVIKIKFVNLWDLSGHSERLNNVQEAYLPITSISWQIV